MKIGKKYFQNALCILSNLQFLAGSEKNSLLLETCTLDGKVGEMSNCRS